jgi:hypothetical protein
MNSKLLGVAVLVCVYVVPALATVELVIGGTTITAGATTVLAAGLVGAKILGLGLGLGLASKVRGRSSGRSHYSSRRSDSSRGSSYGHRRWGRDVSDNEVNEPELLFRSFEESDPAHCFRRYVCDLATGQLHENPSHQAINNIFLQFDYSKSSTFEYEVAFKFGQKLKSIKECEAIYDCPITGYQMDKLFE